MAQSNVNMSKLKRSFQMLAVKIPQRTICEQLHMGRGVLNRYKTLADSQGLSYGVIGRMSDGEIETFLQLSKPTVAPSSRRQVQDRRDWKSVIIASQLPIAKWYDYIRDPTLADAIMDRLVANASKIELKGDSMRQKLKK